MQKINSYHILNYVKLTKLWIRVLTSFLAIRAPSFSYVQMRTANCLTAVFKTNPVYVLKGRIPTHHRSPRSPKYTLFHTKIIKENPDFIRRFVRATQKSLAYTIEHPEEAVDIYLKYIDTQPREVALQTLLNNLALVTTPNTEGKPLGWMAEADWKLTQDFLYNGGVLDLELPLDSYYTNEFVPE